MTSTLKFLLCTGNSSNLIFLSILVLTKLFYISVLQKLEALWDLKMTISQKNRSRCNNVFILQCFLCPYSPYGNAQTPQYNVFSNYTHYSGHDGGSRITLDKLFKGLNVICVRIKTQKHTEEVLRKTIKSYRLMKIL